MTKMVAQSASRALGLLISKDKSFGGMPYDSLNATMLLYRLPLTIVQQCGARSRCHALIQSKTELVGTSLVLGDTHQMLQ